MWELVGRTMRLREREHVPEDGRSDGQDTSVDPELPGVSRAKDQVRVCGVEGVNHSFQAGVRVIGRTQGSP